MLLTTSRVIDSAGWSVKRCANYHCFQRCFSKSDVIVGSFYLLFLMQLRQQIENNYYLSGKNKYFFRLDAFNVSNNIKSSKAQEPSSFFCYPIVKQPPQHNDQQNPFKVC